MKLAAIILALFFIAIPARAMDATKLVKAAAIKFAVPVAIALMVARAESGIRCGQVGLSNERGPLQILPSSAKMLGYSKITKAPCATQTDAGMAHLARCWHGAKGDRRLAIACHNQGFGILKTRKVSQQGARYVRLVMRWKPA